MGRKIMKWLKNEKKIIICFCLFVFMGWFVQQYFGIKIRENVIEQFASIVATSLISLVAFVGMMFVYGFENIDRKRERLASRGMLDEGSRTNFEAGEKLGREKMFKFSFYTFVVAIINLFLIIFSIFIYQNIRLPILFGDVILISYSFNLVIGIMSKVF
ncbi:MAG: hypothetical protein NTY81_01465 [Candidatus Staskawiczbacteria bacterium]|nr:hypothetical protein [Candidatus Staskawiczbacteria bacterium]